MCARTMLAVLDNNKNAGRQQAVITTGPHKGEPRYNVVAPKGRNGWVARVIKERKSYDYVQDMMDYTVELCKTGGQDAPQIPGKELPKNIAREEKPAKEEVVEKHKSRFAKK